jgi:hypothetical protein
MASALVAGLLTPPQRSTEGLPLHQSMAFTATSFSCWPSEP